MDHDGIDHAEDRGGGADPDGESRDRYRRESRVERQHAEAITDVLRELLEQLKPPDLARLLAHEHPVPHPSGRTAPCLLGWEAGFEVLGKLRLEVEPQLVVE